MTIPALWAGPWASTQESWPRFLVVLQRLPQMVRETHRLQEPRRDTRAGCGLFSTRFSATRSTVAAGIARAPNRAKARRCYSHDFAVHVNYCAADGVGCKPTIQPDIGNKRRTSPGAAFCDNKAHHSQRRHGTTGARPPHDQRDAARFNC